MSVWILGSGWEGAQRRLRDIREARNRNVVYNPLHGGHRGIASPGSTRNEGGEMDFPGSKERKTRNTLVLGRYREVSRS